MPGRRKPTGRRSGGSTKEIQRAQRAIALVVRERVPPEVFVEWQVKIWQGHDARMAEDDEGLYATCYCHDPDPGEPARGFVPPTLEQRNRAAQWLTDRGHGQAAQHHVVEGMIKQSTVHELKLEGLSPAALLGIAGALRAALSKREVLALPASPRDDAEDAEVLSETSEPASTIEPASG